jgi:hypothetical protein
LSAGRWLTVVVVTASLCCCAKVQHTVNLTARPLEKPRKSIAMVAKGFQLRGKRAGDSVLVEVAKANYCATRTTQKARGFKVIERRAVGHSLKMEWLTGAVLAGTGGFLIANSLSTPDNGDDPFVAIERNTSLRMYGGTFTLLGTALLAGAVYQTATLGREEIDLGVRMLKRDGLAKPCQLSRAVTGTVRLTLDDGLQLTGGVDPTGHASIKLPADLQRRVKQSGGRATLEVLGDWRSQRRLDVSRDGARTIP